MEERTNIELRNTITTIDKNKNSIIFCTNCYSYHFQNEIRESYPDKTACFVRNDDYIFP